MRIVYAALLVICSCLPAYAAYEVPAKAVWSVTDVDNLQFCNKCDPNSVTASTRIDNYKRTIADTVAMGARNILVHHTTGSDQKTRLTEFATALAQHNTASEPDQRACMAIMYADYGTSHTNEFIQDNWLAAWSGGTNYCVVNNQPVIATLDDRSDWTCSKSKISNVFNRLANFVTAPDNITSAHWLAAFGETSEYTAWSSDCRGQIATTNNIPITYSYLEMANDDPLFMVDSTSRDAAVKANGGRYVLGIPSASATNCGDFCGTLSDASAFRLSEFGGFARMLATWRTDISNLAYTFGPGGRINRDEFASTATRCDPNDLATPAAECTSPVADKLALVPGAPSSGAAVTNPTTPTTPTDPVVPGPTGSWVIAGPQCSNVSAPAPASEKGLTKLEFCDDFSTDSIARGTTAADRTMVAGKHLWNTESAYNFASTWYQPPGDITFPGGGVARIAISANKYQSAIQSAQVRNGKAVGYWIDKKSKGFYVEARFRRTKESSNNQIAFWTMDLCHWHGLPTKCNVRSPAGRFVEYDWLEYSNASKFIHNWVQNSDNSATRGPSCGGGGPGTTLNTWYLTGWRADPNGDNRFYKDNSQHALLGQSQCTGAPMLHNVQGQHPLLIGARVGETFELDYVRVWVNPSE